MPLCASPTRSRTGTTRGQTGDATMTRTGTTARACGNCSLCCKLLAIAELNKPIDTWCPHARPGRGGCSIYPDRPTNSGVHLRLVVRPARVRRRVVPRPLQDDPHAARPEAHRSEAGAAGDRRPHLPECVAARAVLLAAPGVGAGDTDRGPGQPAVHRTERGRDGVRGNPEQRVARGNLHERRAEMNRAVVMRKLQAVIDDAAAIA